MIKEKVKIVILAAGKGTRMKSDLAKVLHKVNGKSMITHVLEMVDEVHPDETYLVVGHQSQAVESETVKYKRTPVLQEQQLGTGHAVMVVEPHLKDYDGMTVILCGDVPLLQAKTVNKLINTYQEGALDAVILTVNLPDPKHYGRIVRDKTAGGLVQRIVEFKDANDQEKAITEINSGIYCFKTKLLFDALKQITNKNNQKEYYLTDVIEIMVRQGRRVGTFMIDDFLQVHGVNDVNDIKIAEEMLAKTA